MDFTTEFNVIKQLDPTVTYIARYVFHSNEIKLYLRYAHDNQYLVLVLESLDSTLVHPYTIIENKKDNYTINGYMGKDIKIAAPLMVNNMFNAFYLSLKKAILTIPTKGTPDIAISTKNPLTATHDLKDAVNNSTSAGDRRYYYYSRASKSISINQQNKIKLLLGSAALSYLSDNHLTAAFTSDPSKQKTLYISENK